MKKMIKSSELINAYPPENLDCGVPCYMAGPDSKCELFIFDENKNCHKGSFDTTDGELQTAAEKVNMHLQRGKETLKIFKIAKNLIFAHTLTNSEKVNFVTFFVPFWILEHFFMRQPFGIRTKPRVNQS